MKNIPYGRQNINQDDIDAVVSVLKSDFLTQGTIVPEFEIAISEYCNVKHAIAVNSATSSLHIACLAIGLQPGDYLWTSPITFVASANCAKYCGANVDFIDIDPRTYNISIERLTDKLELAEKENRIPKVIMAVHLCGQSCDMESIYNLSKRFGFKIIEDASHALGAKYKGEAVGSCKFSDITVFSLHPVKIITTGEGGIALTNNSMLADKMVRLRSHGITRSPKEMTRTPDGGWFYQQLELGYNFRLTDFAAALGLSQFKRLDQFITRRHEIAKLYTKLLSNSNIVTPWQNLDTYSSFHLYVVRIPNSRTLNRNLIFERLRSNGILVNLHYIPVYQHPYYERFGYDYSLFPEAEKYYSEAISLPIFPGLLDSDVESIVEIINKPINHQTIF